MSNIRILWADDEIEMLKPHILFLEGKGYEVDAVVSGNEAIEMVMENHYDIVFLDEQMPGMSGFELLEVIRANPAYAHIRILVVSAAGKVRETAMMPRQNR